MVSEKMNAGQQRDPIIDFSNWLKTSLGQYVMAWEQSQFDVMVTDIFGYHAVQLGLPELNALRTSRMPACFSVIVRQTEMQLLSEQVSDQAADQDSTVARNHPHGASNPYRHTVLTQLEDLPFASQSIDLLVMPHMLEFSRNPHQILREVERVLIPEGQVIISGFNPVSLWGIRQVLGRTVERHFVPPEGQFLTLPRLKDWLKLLSFEVNRGRYGCYCPPLRSEKWRSRYRFMEKAGDRWWPICGAVYMISAVKRVRGMHLIGPTWKDSKAPLRSLNPATAPSASARADQSEQSTHG